MRNHKVDPMPKVLSLLALVCLSMTLAASSLAAPPSDLQFEQVLGVDRVAAVPDLNPAADVLSVSLYRSVETGRPWLRISFLTLGGEVPPSLAMALATGRDKAQVTVSVVETSTLRTLADLNLNRDGDRFLPAVDKAAGLLTTRSDADAIYLPLDEAILAGATTASPVELSIGTTAGAVGDEVRVTYPADKAYAANCAFVLHGNQGIGYSDVFHGRSDDLEGSGFDEALQVHESTNIPGNFHMSGTLMTSAEWAARNGDPTDFNAWLSTGVTAGWAGMVTSAYGQHMMPFVNNEMNDWAVSIQTQMVNTRYGYFPTVAWIPERVWLNTTGYPSSGVNDWIGDNWQAHGVNGVILDDDVHLSGHDNHQIHTLTANGLRLIPRDRNFTGNIIGGNGQASLDILTGLAGSGVGEFRIAVFAEDWEAASEMGGWADIVPNAKETYDWFIGKCSTESAWLSTWKLADALANANFNGDTFDPTPGTYNEIGGFNGYGGSDNSWYTHWAGFVPFVNGGDGSGACAGGSGNCKNYGTLWNEAYSALLAAPDNNISQAGWYVLMTNLHETAWHDYQGGPISGWQHKYSAHMKNAMIYAEASHWANGEYATTTNVFFSDIDNDGHMETVIHNDHLFGVLEGDGGRLTNLFVKGSGYEDTAIGVDNAYWEGTDGDFNDANHVGAFSDVSPNYQHTGSLGALSLDGTTVSVTMVINEVTKTVTLTESLVDLTWNGELDRIWVTDGSYMGFRNPNTGIAAAFVLGAGGASHQKEIAGTLMRGDELFGSGVFQYQLFAGATSAPDGSGEIAELRVLADNLVDTIGPDVTASSYFTLGDRLRVIFDQPAFVINPADFQVMGQFGSVSLPAGTTFSETEPTLTVTFDLDPATASAIEAMIPDGDMYLGLAAGGVTDEADNDNEAVTVPPGVTIGVISTVIAIDGNIETAEWADSFEMADSNDSAWSAANEIDRLLVRWDADFLYLAIDGEVSGNSWLLYLDRDPGTANGQTDLTATDAWERGASFTAPGFAADFQYGCYQHQSVFDGDGFWELLTSTTTQDRSDEIESAYDSYHTFGAGSGSELAIPWDTIYGLGDGVVPVNAEIALMASVCWDPEPDGVLGGDSAPSNMAAALPTLDSSWTLTVDGNGDGTPDPLGVSAVPGVPTAVSLLPNVPNPFNPGTTLRFEIPGRTAARIDLAVFDLRGHRIRTLITGPMEPGTHEIYWNGRSDDGQTVAAGTYISRLTWSGQSLTRPLSLVK